MSKVREISNILIGPGAVQEAMKGNGVKAGVAVVVNALTPALRNYEEHRKANAEPNISNVGAIAETSRALASTGNDFLGLGGSIATAAKVGLLATAAGGPVVGVAAGVLTLIGLKLFHGAATRAVIGGVKATADALRGAIPLAANVARRYHR